MDNKRCCKFFSSVKVANHCTWRINW